MPDDGRDPTAERKPAAPTPTSASVEPVDHEVSIVHSLLFPQSWMAVCSCRWVGVVQDRYHDAVTDGIDHKEAHHGR